MTDATTMSLLSSPFHLRLASDQRFADLEWDSLRHDRTALRLTLGVAADPADGAAEVVLDGVEALDVSGFGRQNVLSDLGWASMEGAELDAFAAWAEREGAKSLYWPRQKPLRPPGPRLAVAFAPANGAQLFAICQSVEKRDAAGRALHRVEA